MATEMAKPAPTAAPATARLATRRIRPVVVIRQAAAIRRAAVRVIRRAAVRVIRRAAIPSIQSAMECVTSSETPSTVA
jgi:hypothetical protein